MSVVINEFTEEFTYVLYYAIRYSATCVSKKKI